MSAAMLTFLLFLVAITCTVGRCTGQTTHHDDQKNGEYWKQLLTDAQKEVGRSRGSRGRLLRGSEHGKYPPICYPDIGCFSPSTGILKDFFETLYPYSPEDMQTKFRLFTRQRPDHAPRDLRIDFLDSLETKEFNPEVPVVLIVHGFNDNGLSEWIISLKEELLKINDFNVIAVDYRNGVKNPLYGQAIVNAELVSRQAARLLVLLKEKRGYDIKKTHIIGYSLGAHAAGFISKYLKQLGEGQVARISGLDAAGPLFEDKDEKVHLSYHDADFVDAIHTSASNGSGVLGSLFWKSFGIMKAIGHVDFYPNGGESQPGCGILGISLPFIKVSCYHGRAPLFYIESINSECQFKSYACKGGYDEFKAEKCAGHLTSRLGYHSNAGNSRGVFYLDTQKSSPFCKK